MKKYIGSVMVNTETGQLFQADNGVEIKLPYDIARAYEIYCIFEYLKENYTNDDETLWQLASETREVEFECEANGSPVTEGEAIELACNNLNITLDEE